jgi:hypothetical protein
MSNAVPTLLESVSNIHCSLTQLLLQTNSIASRLGFKDIHSWVDLELNGYAEESDPPAYRKVFSHSLEFYHPGRENWQFAGNLNYVFKVRQPIAEIEKLSHESRVTFPVSKSFSIKNDLGDSFGSDWPQRFVVLGAEYNCVIKAVTNRWSAELEKRGLKVFDLEKLMVALASIGDFPSAE